MALCRSHLATYKCPREVRFVDDLPRNALGKVQKAVLRREICASE
jgi:acyl-coenzyme A synthetase/AMP-(fatty) acid ligase